MADLPEARLEPASTFTYCAVDCFGSWLVKQGRKDLKRYGALFTCMATRHVHIEVSDSLSTDSFPQALRRFIARKGPIREILCDQGTNFIGANNEPKDAYEEMDDDRIKTELLKSNIDWALNPPAASHFGGGWERQIRSIRSILSALIKEHGNRLNIEALRTWPCETEAIINNRPLTVETLCDPCSPLPLTPMTLLTGKSKVALPPPGKFQRTDLYCKWRWRQVQHLANEFWKRWRNEFQQGLQSRQKWSSEKPNFQEEDVVLLKDKDLARNQWSMAEVVDTRTDDHRLVRSVKLRMPNGSTLEHPIDKLVLLLEVE